ETVPGFAALGANERQAIFEFTLLWSLFEAKALASRASAAKIIEVTTEVDVRGRLRIEPFEEHIAYFCDRYYVNNEPTNYFQHLHLRKNDKPALVKRVLQRQQA